MARSRREKLRLVAAATALAMAAPIVASTVVAVRDSSGPPDPATRADGDGDAGDAGSDGSPAAAGADVALYGDSLSFEAASAFQLHMASEDVEPLISPLPGRAICDFIDPIRRDVTSGSPEVALLQFVGNNLTDCVRTDGGEEPTGQALADRYAADAREVTELLVDQGVQVVWVQPPPAPGLPGQATSRIDRAYRDLVDEWESRAPGQVHYAAAAEPVTGPDGGFVETMPCLDDETARVGCDDGRIRVRNPDRIHFCPVEMDERGCPADYSSGARRYAEAMADAALRLL